MFNLLNWWYKEGWRQTSQEPKRWLRKIYREFSVPLLLKTMFSPWRRIISFPGRSFSDHVRAMIDNFISRTIGFIVRLIVLLAATLSMIFIVLVAAIEVIIWPLLPPSIILFIILGII